MSIFTKIKGKTAIKAEDFYKMLQVDVDFVDWMNESVYNFGHAEQVFNHNGEPYIMFSACLGISMVSDGLGAVETYNAVVGFV
jgi:hypothetical protein